MLRTKSVSTDDLLWEIAESHTGIAAEVLSQAGVELEPPAEAEPEKAALEEIHRVAHEHAVMFESEEIGPDHLLLAIVVVNKGRAAELIEEEQRDRIWDALLAEFGHRGDPFGLLSGTGREAFGLAWSHALAVGRETIGVEDLLRGVSAPGWTIGARALADLGTVPEWQPTLWVQGPGSDPYRRIGFDDQLQAALELARGAAADLGSEFIGTEHLVLGIAQVEGALESFLGRRVGAEQVRNAVTQAISSGEAARDAEARRQGWDPERDRERDLVDRWVDGAREVAEKSDGRSPESSEELLCWPGLMAAILLNRDEGLEDLLEDMLLEPLEIHDRARGVEDLPLSAAIAAAEAQRPRDQLEPVDLILAAIAVGSPRVLTGLGRIGLTGHEVLGQLREWQLRRAGDDSGTASILAASGVNILLSSITTVALLQAVVSQGAWWKLIFLPLVWSGYPNYGPLGGSVIAAVLGFAVSPLVGALHLLGIPAEVVQATAERQAIWTRTGVRLTLREQRCTTRRRLGEMGRINQGMRQIARSSLPARLRRDGRR